MAVPRSTTRPVVAWGWLGGAPKLAVGSPHGTLRGVGTIWSNRVDLLGHPYAPWGIRRAP